MEDGNDNEFYPSDHKMIFYCKMWKSSEKENFVRVKVIVDFEDLLFPDSLGFLTNPITYGFTQTLNKK